MCERRLDQVCTIEQGNFRQEHQSNDVAAGPLFNNTSNFKFTWPGVGLFAQQSLTNWKHLRVEWHWYTSDTQSQLCFRVTRKEGGQERRRRLEDNDMYWVQSIPSELIHVCHNSAYTQCRWQNVIWQCGIPARNIWWITCRVHGKYVPKPPT